MPHTSSSVEFPPVRVALVDGDIIYRKKFIAAIKVTTDLKLSDFAASRAEGLALLQSKSADVLIVDLALSDGCGIDVIREAHNQWPTCAVMVNTHFDDSTYVIRSIEAGAKAYLLKENRPENLIQEIRCLYNGGSPISPLIARQVLVHFRQRMRHSPVPNKTTILSTQEKHVLDMITRGFSAKEIAHMLQISQHTVDTYVRRIYSKLKVKSKSEAIYEARKHRLVNA